MIKQFSSAGVDFCWHGGSQQESGFLASSRVSAWPTSTLEFVWVSKSPLFMVRCKKLYALTPPTPVRANAWCGLSVLSNSGRAVCQTREAAGSLAGAAWPRNGASKQRQGSKVCDGLASLGNTREAACACLCGQHAREHFTRGQTRGFDYGGCCGAHACFACFGRGSHLTVLMVAKPGVADGWHAAQCAPFATQH